ncbi:hypothetical protein AYI70_g11957 [Smittium culicis]|uniref:Uncharacterized protein n=1 Tax=Smittium culicis TaxID=133412 RepID=A0A1R1WZH9_9FUNG|nr:hypothetical protein AYI70_g11957 [Smittium culicis]
MKRLVCETRRDSTRIRRRGEKGVKIKSNKLAIVLASPPKSFLTIKKRAQKKLASQPVLCYLKAWFGCLRFCYQFCLPPPKFSIGHRDGRAL